MSESKGRATLTYYGHNTKELGHEVPHPKGLTTNVKLDLVTAAGQATVKQRMRAQLAWLMEEGKDYPVFLDVNGLAAEVDTEALELELAPREGEADAQASKQAGITYDVPSRQELRDAKDIARETARGLLGGLRRKKKK